MTVIVGLVTPHGAWLGSDSAAVMDDHFSATSSPKVVRVGETLIGFAGEYGSGQVAIEWWRSHPRPTVHSFAAEFRSKPLKCSLLVIERGNLYEVDEGCAVLRAKKTLGAAYAAIGSGWIIATGALFAAHRTKDDLLTALKAANKYSTTVCPPYRIIASEK